MSHDLLSAKLASAREKLFNYDRSFETLMINGPEYVIDEMVAEIERLRKEVIYLKGTIGNIKKHENYARRKAFETNAANILLDAENRKLRKALEFYADEANYNRITLSLLTAKVLLDNGDLARQALEVTK